MRHETPDQRARRIRQEARGPERPPRTIALLAFAIGLLVAAFLLHRYLLGPLFGG